jgi:hypothetical protein
MKTMIRHTNLGLLVAIAILIVSGLILYASGNERLSTKVFFVASAMFPFALAAKGIEYIINNQLIKAFLSIIFLSLICMLSIIFVFI